MRLKRIISIFFLAGAAACSTAKTATNTPTNAGAILNNAQLLNESTNKSTPAEQQVPPAQAVTASALETNVKTGDTGTAEVTVNIAPGYHINTNPADSEYLRPTELKIASSNQIKFGKPFYPTGEKLKFAFTDAPISVYTGSVKIKIPVRVAAGAKSGEMLFTAKVEAQPCNDNACFPSRTVEFVLTVKINP